MKKEDVKNIIEDDMEAHPENYFVNPDGHIKDRILVHENADIPSEGLFVGLNGVQYLLKPGHEIELPRPIRGVLDSCIETKTFQDGNGKSYTRDIPRVTYTLLKEGVNLTEATK